MVDMLLTGFDAPVEQVLYLDRSLKEHGLLQAIARVNRRFSHEQDGVLTEKSHGLVVDYHGVSRNLEEALANFDRPDVQESMKELEEDPGRVIEAAAVQAESHFKGRELNNTWALCSSVFAPDASTDGDYKADLFQRFDCDYRSLSLTSWTATYLIPRHLTTLTAWPASQKYGPTSRAQFLREDANVHWTAVGAKVKKLIDERIGAKVRTADELRSPFSTRTSKRRLQTCRMTRLGASIMEHAIRAQIHERMAGNPVYYEKLSTQLDRIIQDLRNQVIDAAEACRRQLALRKQVRSEADFAAKHGLSPISFAIYEMLESIESRETTTAGVLQEEQASYRTHFDKGLRSVALNCRRTQLSKHLDIVDWQANDEVQTNDATGYQAPVASCRRFHGAADRQPSRPHRGIGGLEKCPMNSRDKIRFGDTTIEYNIRRSTKRRKTVQVTVDGGGVQVAAPSTAEDSKLREIVRKRAPWILDHSSDGLLAVPSQALCQWRNSALPRS